MGTPKFALPALEKLISNPKFEVVAVYTKEPKIAGRGHKIQNSAIHELALKHNLKVLTPKTLREKSVQEEFSNFKADAAVVVAYGLLLPQEILEGTKFGCFNIHPSLLPKWRGAAPLQRTIMAGDTETAVDIIQMNEGLDSGDVVAEERFNLDGSETYSSLETKCAEIGAKLTEEVLEKLAAGDALSPRKQDDSKAVYAKKLEKTECEIDWNFSAKEIDQKIRGLNGSLGAYATLDGIFGNEKIKIFAAEIIEKDEKFPTEKIGKFVDENFKENGVQIYCKTGILKLLEIQKPGGKRMSVEEVLRGI